ncbi:cupin domain-containing protein [Iningainema tapete]|uniref:dTDP-4-dehydrorhamnose 3,5-epimerase family protein n=1 Tax=Iningainema tapete BLCC-T55 TaxID=2748662 RepID=A0A8J6XF99_9CYAN|nr:dTDP-4-dehydrorhamnose 3,5-epimerase family protein [Iningainema tapete]MBD2771552.1 dTDP-4-dehydrorhamnose 3,5-epimerase family protein [Iningainema tapete BLCC-T55]
MLEGAVKAQKTVKEDGTQIFSLLHGVQIKEMKNVVTRSGVTTEAFRMDWNLIDYPINQIIHVTQRPGAINAWHYHAKQTDHIFVTDGTIRAVLFDDRSQSPTQGQVSVLHLGRMTPTLLIIPPGIWHGVQNLENSTTGFLNFFDQTYCYDDPDGWTLPWDTDKIPYQFVK